MSLDYEVNEEHGLLTIFDPSPLTHKTIQQLCNEIPELARELGVSKILVDQHKIPNPLNTMERFWCASQIAKYFMGLKIVFVQDAPIGDLEMFIENDAVNREANVCMCVSFEEAYEWLEVESTKERKSAALDEGSEFKNHISRGRKKSKLFILIGIDKIQSFELESGKVYSIGRSPMNTIQLKDSHVSRYHLQVRYKDGKYYIKDLMTKNGTFVRGEDIAGGVEIEVAEGTPITIGMTVIGFGKRFESSCLPFLVSTGICCEVDENGEIKKPFRSMTIRNNLGCIYNVNKALSKTKDINEIIEILLDNIFNLLKRIDRCAIILYDDKKEEISRVEYKSRKADYSFEKTFNEDMVLKSLTLNETIMIRDAYDNDFEDYKLTKSLQIMKIGSAACVPMCTYYNTMGAIYVDSLERPYGFRKNDIAILKDIGTRAALAMDSQ